MDLCLKTENVNPEWLCAGVYVDDTRVGTLTLKSRFLHFLISALDVGVPLATAQAGQFVFDGDLPETTATAKRPGT